MADMEWDGDNIQALIFGSVMEGIVLGAEFLLTESRAEVPIDEATLERSGAVTQDPQKLIACVAYDTPYAARQHEDMNHRHAPGRKAKYLEDPANANTETIIAIVATHARRQLERG